MKRPGGERDIRSRGLSAPDSSEMLTRGGATAGYAYTAREWDPETGLYYYRARYYDPKIGRFISEDPIGLHGGINLYGYVGNEPVGRYDPYGWAEGPPPSWPTPPSNIPGGPWTWYPDPNNSRGGVLRGPAGPGQQQQANLTWAPPIDEGGKGYWKVKLPGQTAQRYDEEGNPMTPQETHPSRTKPSPPVPPGLPPGVVPPASTVCPVVPIIHPCLIVPAFCRCDSNGCVWVGPGPPGDTFY
jgi:RHS repeat-associated protein